MSIEIDVEIKRWTAKRKSALVMEIIQGKKTVAEASRQFDLPPSGVEESIDQARAGMENALRAKPEDVRQQYERQLQELQEAYREAMLEWRARKKLESLLGKDETGSTVSSRDYWRAATACRAASCATGWTATSCRW